MLIGTSLAVYPAAGLIDFVPGNVTKYIIDPRVPSVGHYQNIIKIERSTTEGVKELMDYLVN